MFYFMAAQIGESIADNLVVHTEQFHRDFITHSVCHCGRFNDVGKQNCANARIALIKFGAGKKLRLR